MMGIVSSTSVPNDLLDQRDSLLRKLSELVDITVAYKTGGLVEVNAGTSGPRSVSSFWHKRFFTFSSKSRWSFKSFPKKFA